MVTLPEYLKPLLLVSITLSLLTLGARVDAADDWTWNEGSNLTEANAWRETGDALWLCGGSGVACSAGLLNDLWRYAPAAGTWTWVSGLRPCGRGRDRREPAVHARFAARLRHFTRPFDGSLTVRPLQARP